MQFSKHADKRFKERLSITREDLINRLSNQAVLERIEKTGERHLILWIPEEREFFCFVICDNQIITLMPLIWRAKQVSESVLEEARNRVDFPASITPQQASKKVGCQIHTIGPNPRVLNFNSRCIGATGIDKDKLLNDFNERLERYHLSRDQIYSFLVQLDTEWVNMIDSI